MIAVVLGATGFIGGQIALAALEHGWSVRGLRRDPKATGVLADLPIDWVDGDLTNHTDLSNAFSGVDVVFHAAAFYPKRHDLRSLNQQIEYAGNEIDRIIETADKANVMRLVYTSSLSTIGFPPADEDRMANEDDFYQPGDINNNAYYESKYVMEQRVLTAAKNGLHAVILNPTAVFGPGDIHLTTGKILLNTAIGRMIAWIPGVVNVIDVRDLADAHINAVEQGAIGERYIIGGHNLSIKEALSTVADIAGKPRPRFEIPVWALKLITKIDDYIPRINLTGNHLQPLIHWHGFENTKSRTVLGLSPRPFVDTIRDSLAWFRQQGYVQ